MQVESIAVASVAIVSVVWSGDPQLVAPDIVFYLVFKFGLL